MLAKLKEYNLKLWDLNIILTIVGFPVFTMLVTTSWSSIAFRGLAAVVALFTLWKTKINIPHNGLIRIFLFILLYESIQMWVDFYFGEYANSQFVYPKMQAMLFNIGVVWLPVLAVCSSLDRINWNTVLWASFLLLGFSVIKGDLSSVGAELTVDGRVNMSDRISPISYGDYSAFLVLLSSSLMLKYRTTKLSLFNLTTIILFIGIFAGIFGVAKAGSRGPLVGMTCGFFYLFWVFPKRWKAISLIILVVAVFTGALSMSLLEEFAPALVARFTATIEEGDTGQRDILFGLAMQKWEGHQLLGTNCIYLEAKEFNSYHNVYLDAFVSTGIVGGLVFCITMLRLTLKSYLSRYKNMLTPAAYFFIALFLFHFGRGFSGIILIANAQIAVSFVIAAYVAKGNLHSSNI